MKLGINPTVDFVFKMLLGNKDHPKLTLDFLNSLFAKIGEPAVREVEYLDPKALPRQLMVSSFPSPGRNRVGGSSHGYADTRDRAGEMETLVGRCGKR
jgi:hypothetical protein